jgi:hypothetical protein
MVNAAAMEYRNEQDMNDILKKASIKCIMTFFYSRLTDKGVSISCNICNRVLLMWPDQPVFLTRWKVGGRRDDIS